MQNIDIFGDICEEYADVADFVTIYISEAHPVESGDLADFSVKFREPTEIKERKKNAEFLREQTNESFKENCRFLVDYMDNAANEAYAGLPERLYIILNGKIVYAGDVGPMGYKPDEIVHWLNAHKNGRKYKST